MSSSSVEEIVTDCLAVRVRLIGRALTSLYDSALGGHDVTIAQVNLLAALGMVGPCAPSQLGEVLQLERSTVSRNVNLLLNHGWIEALSSDAKGIREVELTRAGRAKIESVMPQWRQAQRQATELLGTAGANAIQAIASNMGYPPGS
ncbi:MarR family winged helix-turn-helix transcriptional regulator [Amycolatopsis sp. NPDC101161]|uniref:MarR family winged helix-turn-helix transcriptional regulator n=1 Tax=Amycolatopsis sp. NPDC101161 TaxID=3363940 RepID=UPI0037FD7768